MSPLLNGIPATLSVVPGPGNTSPPPSIPLIAPQPPRLSEHLEELCALEESGVFSNYGPVNALLERELIAELFGSGSCVTVCNATLGLMIAMQEVLGDRPASGRRYALMPSFTFAAAAQAAAWCGLTPLFCDIDPETWMADEASEEALLKRYAGQVALFAPYATFGNDLNLERYAYLAKRHGLPVVVDAAASMGCLDQHGRHFGTGFPWAIVYSMQATKVFSVGEGGLIYSADPARIERLRRMGSFGFAGERAATSIGLNSKMSELTALVARLQLRNFAEAVRHREHLAAAYTADLRDHFDLQHEVGARQIRSFFPVLLPRELAPARGRILDRLKAEGIGAGTYFSPHVAQQPYFRTYGESGPLPVTTDVAARVLSLPLSAQMSVDQVHRVTASLGRAIGSEMNAASFPSAAYAALTEQSRVA